MMFKKYFIFILFLTIKGFEWYFRDSRNNNNNNLDNYQPIRAPYNDNNVSNSKFCPICKLKIQNPACLSVSGYQKYFNFFIHFVKNYIKFNILIYIKSYVFCYSCIIEFIRKRKMCPITNIECTESCVYKIFLSNN